jgi:hypothetical protein
MVPWRELARRFPEATHVDVEAYARLFDAVDDAQRRGEAWEPGPADVEWYEVRHKSNGETVRLAAVERPVMPVRADDPARLVVALLQRERWHDAHLWAGGKPVDLRDTGKKGRLPDVETLLRRNLTPDAATAADLVRFGVSPHAKACPVAYSDAHVSAVLRLIEKNFPPPVPAELRPPLREMIRRLEVIAGQVRAHQRKYRMRLSTKLADKAVARVRRLLGDNADGVSA